MPPCISSHFIGKLCKLSISIKNILDQLFRKFAGHIDSDILDSTKRSDTSHIGHIDSPENSDNCQSDPANSESIIDDLSSLNQDLFSTMLEEKYDSVKECLKSEKIDKPCSLARFAEGSDIARQSFRRALRYSSKVS